MKALLVILALFSTSAFAIGWGNDNPASNQTNIQATSVDVSNRISQDVRNNALSFAGGGSAKSFNSLTVNEAPIPANTTQSIHQDSYTVKGVPNVFSGNVYPTAPCMGSSTVGGAGVGFGFSVGSSWTDDECGIRETARSFAGMGMKEDSLAILCTSKYAAAAPSCPKPVAKE
jgi:hypothetical protein